MHPFLYHNKNVPTAPAVTCLKYIVFLPSPHMGFCAEGVQTPNGQSTLAHSHTRHILSSP